MSFSFCNVFALIADRSLLLSYELFTGSNSTNWIFKITIITSCNYLFIFDEQLPHENNLTRWPQFVLVVKALVLS